MTTGFYIGEWAQKKHQELRNSDVTNLDNLIALIIIFGVCGFAKNDSQNGPNSSPFRSTAENFSCDASLFEIGCFLIFYIDISLKKVYPSFQKAVVNSFSEKFLELTTDAFSGIIGRETLADIFIERRNKYHELCPENGCNALLIQLLDKSKDNSTPKTLANLQLDGELSLSVDNYVLTNMFTSWWTVTGMPFPMKIVVPYCKDIEMELYGKEPLIIADVNADSETGFALGPIASGTTLTFKYIEGTWLAEGGYSFESPDNALDDHHCLALENETETLAVLPANTIMKPFSYLFKNVAKNAILRINSNGDFKKNTGTVKYVIFTKKPANP